MLTSVKRVWRLRCRQGYSDLSDAAGGVGRRIHFAGAQRGGRGGASGGSASAVSFSPVAAAPYRAYSRIVGPVSVAPPGNNIRHYPANFSHTSALPRPMPAGSDPARGCGQRRSRSAAASGTAAPASVAAPNFHTLSSSCPASA